MSYLNQLIFLSIHIIPWEHGRGFAINRTVWNEIVEHVEEFCTYDDSNWDWTLRYISQKCIPSVLLSMTLVRPRVFHIGAWFVFILQRVLLRLLNSISNFSGVHFEEKDCDPNFFVTTIDKLQRYLLDAHQLYPKILSSRF